MAHLDRSLVDVYRHTVSLCNNLAEDNLLNQPQSTVYTIVEPNYQPQQRYEKKVVVRVVNQDTFEAAEEITQKGHRPLVLNLASDFKPGGGVEKGAKAQEEDLFRRSDYYRHLDRRWYPLKPTHAILSPGVTVIKDTEYNKQKPYFQVDCLAVAGLRHPKLVSGKFQPKDEELLRTKIRQIFQIADQHKYDYLVLGALGCGAFGNPPEEVARIFKEELDKFEHSFVEVVFAVLCRRDLYNYQIFSTILASSV